MYSEKSKWQLLASCVIMLKKDPDMQNKYVADVGDFGKFQLFRYLFNHNESVLDGRELTQIWFMHQGIDEANNDGRHIDYFERMSGTDAYLEHSLRDILMRNKREVIELEKSKLLNNAKYFYEDVPKTLKERYLWLKTALAFAHKSQIIAVEPDNGMALRCNRVEKSFEHLILEEHHQKKASPHKYIFADEVGHFYRLPYLEVCIVYQHLNRCFSHNAQISALLSDLRKEYVHVLAIKHKPYSPRVFFFLCKSNIIKENTQRRLEQFASEFSSFWEVFS